MTVTSFSPKQPSEEDHYKFDFSARLGSREIDSVVSVTATDIASSEDVTDTVTDSTKIYNDTDSVYVWLQNGESGHRYKITVIIEAEDESIHELDAHLIVRDY